MSIWWVICKLSAFFFFLMSEIVSNGVSVMIASRSQEEIMSKTRFCEKMVNTHYTYARLAIQIIQQNVLKYSLKRLKTCVKSVSKVKTVTWHEQKQPFRGVLRKRCSENMQQIYRRTPFPTNTPSRLLLHAVREKWIELRETYHMR